jgi:enoyl-CoA hydratase/carnithine racemase
MRGNLAMLQDIAQDAAAIRLEIEDGIATLLLNRPSVRNAIDDAMRAELADTLDRVSRDDAIRAVVVTGAGKAFCAGGDVRGMRQRLEAPLTQVAINGWRRQQRTHHAVAALHALNKPVIAAVNGAAAGLGCDVVLCCDFIIASDQASFAMTYIQRGLIPDGGGMYFLPRRVGLVRAKELIFSGRRVAPEEALAIGMIDRVTGAERLLEDAKAWARELSGGSLAALALSKSVLNQTFELTVGQVFDMGSQAQAICYSTQEHRDSIAAFLAKSATKSGDRS